LSASLFVSQRSPPAIGLRAAASLAGKFAPGITRIRIVQHLFDVSQLIRPFREFLTR
jgi:hypothetical protein